jgi:hypothetical protein
MPIFKYVCKECDHGFEKFVQASTVLEIVVLPITFELTVLVEAAEIRADRVPAQLIDIPCAPVLL